VNPVLKLAARALTLVERALTFSLLFVIRAYQSLHVAFFRGSCRFHPTCSHYALEAIRLHGPGRGSLLTAWRILRCQPFCRGGYDPVPEPKQKQAGRTLKVAGQMQSRQDRPAQQLEQPGVFTFADFPQPESLTQNVVGTQRERARQGTVGATHESPSKVTVSRRSQQVPLWRLT
jgi:putative membrane protein insertion efficiency factor